MISIRIAKETILLNTSGTLYIQERLVLITGLLQISILCNIFVPITRIRHLISFFRKINGVDRMNTNDAQKIVF